MAKHTFIDKILSRKMLAASLKIILLVLALLNLFGVFAQHGHVCFHNWSGEFYAAFSVLIAVIALCIGKVWSYFVAIFACCLALYDFCKTALLFLGFLPSPPNTDASEIRFEDWLRIMQHNPEEFIHAIFAAMVLVVSAIHLFNSLMQKRRFLK